MTFEIHALHCLMHARHIQCFHGNTNRYVLLHITKRFDFVVYYAVFQPFSHKMHSKPMLQMLQ